MPVVWLAAGRDLRVLVDRLRPVRQLGLGESMKDGEVYHCTIHGVETESRGQMQQHIDREHPGGVAKDAPDEFLRPDGDGAHIVLNLTHEEAAELLGYASHAADTRPTGPSRDRWMAIKKKLVRQV